MSKVWDEMVAVVKFGSPEEFTAHIQKYGAMWGLQNAVSKYGSLRQMIELLEMGNTGYYPKGFFDLNYRKN